MKRKKLEKRLKRAGFFRWADVAERLGGKSCQWFNGRYRVKYDALEPRPGVAGEVDRDIGKIAVDCADALEWDRQARLAARRYYGRWSKFKKRMKRDALLRLQ